jgi:hypothetical protein
MIGYRMAFGLLLGLAVVAGAAPASDALAQTGQTPVYKPPLRGAPQGRVGGATRGAADDLPKLEVLAPDHVGHSAAEQPTLYWFVSKPVRAKLQVTLASESSIKPELEVDVAQPVVPGIQAFSLAAHGLRLKPDVDYEFSVALVANPAERSSDLTASGVVRRVAAPAEVTGDIAKMAPLPRSAALAERGLWYDALTVLGTAIAERPNDRSLRLARAALLDQVGLGDVAEFERRSP